MSLDPLPQNWAASLVARPLRRTSVHGGWLLWHLNLGGELGKHGLVCGHAGGKTSEVGHLVGQTNGATVQEHEVARLALDLVDLEDTLVHHGGLKALQEVLAETHWPAVADLGGGLGELVDQTVDGTHGVGHLDSLAGENGRELIAPHANSLPSRGVHGTEGAHGQAKVTDG